jgi:hypothetical protein
LNAEIPILAALQEKKVGIFQEIFMLDDRLSVDIENFAQVQVRLDKEIA